YGSAYTNLKEALQYIENDDRTNLYYALSAIHMGFLKDAESKLEMVKNGELEEEVETAVFRIAEIRKQSVEIFLKGEKLYAKGDYDGALRNYRRAVKMNGDNAEAKYKLFLTGGIVLFRKGGRWELWDSIVQFGKASQIKPEKAEPHYYMARAYLKKNGRDFDSAIEEYESALKLEPDGKFADEIKKEIVRLKEKRDFYRNFWEK
ncbi:MAG: tetratricopeptide repeat protein, partial [Fidelibacterota bacterium]